PPLGVPPLSCSTTVTTAEPGGVEGLNVSVPSGATAGCTSNRAGLLAVAMKLRAWPASLGPGETLVAQFGIDTEPASRVTFTFGPAVKPGASLTPTMLRVKVCGALVSWPPLAVPPLSWARTVTVATPKAFGAVV